MTKRLIVLPVLLLCGLGVVMVFSASAVYADLKYGSAHYFLVRHLAVLAVGAVVMWAAARQPPERLLAWSRPLLFFTVVCMVLVLIPGIGRAANNARRWLVLGPVSFQPAELAKLALVLYLGDFLGRRAQEGPRGRTPEGLFASTKHLRAAAILIVLACLQPDFGTAVILTSLTFVGLFLAGTQLSTLALAGLAALPVAYHMVVTSPYRLRRILAFIDPFRHRHGLGYQIAESLISIGSGGASGLGLGEGKQKLFFLPEAHTDFIFAIIGEELGLIGAIAVVACFVLLAIAGTLTALRAASPGQTIVAIGITVLISMQALINIGSSTGMLPTKGLTLPFVSYGRTSLVMCMLMVGVLLSIAGQPARATERATSKQRTTPQPEEAACAS